MKSNMTRVDTGLQMSRSGGRRLARLAVGFNIFAATLLAQPPSPNPVVLAAKLDAEGLSQMLIPVAIDGHAFWCNADSGGSRVLSLDLDKALAAGLTPNAAGSSAGVGPEVRRDQRVRGTTVGIGSVALRDMTIVLTPRPTVVPDIDCVLGLGLLTEYAIEFDYLTPAVRMLPAAIFHPPAAAVGVPLTIDRIGMPSTTARLRLADGDVVDATLMVDTGASYYDVVLLRPFVDANRIAQRIGTTVPRFSDTPGMSLSAARATALTVGPFQVAGPVTALISTSSGGTFSMDGMIGTGFLRRFKATFDYAHERLWLEPNGRPQTGQDFDASGLELRPTADREYAIVAVSPDSAAAEAGLAVGDVLKEIDGHRASAITFGEIQRLLSRPDATCSVSIESRGKRRTASLHLRRRL